jgi:hypothetical protein
MRMRCAMAKRKLRTIGVGDLLHLQEDSARHLYWRGRRLTAADLGYLFLALTVIGAVCDLIKTGIDIGSAAGWWP